MDLDLPVILGTVREGRKSEYVARYIHARLAARPGITSALVDPRETGFGNLTQRVKDLPEFDAKIPADVQVAPEFAAFIRRMHAADGFVIVTPEYNYSFPGALKNLLDVTLKPWNRKPFALVGCGGLSGGLRAIDSLRQVISGIEAVTIPAHMPVFQVEKSFTPEGPVDKEAFDRRVDHVLAQLEWYAGALKVARRA